MSLLTAPRWTGRCLVCGTRVTRSWWQRGLFTPLPLCDRAHTGRERRADQ